MSRLMNFITPLHKSTPRDYLARMLDNKVQYMLKAKEYEKDYWDGDRRCGYGGYKYDGRWKGVAEKMIETYGLRPNAKILDVGCGKGHLLYELQKLLPQAELHGFDISRHALADAPESIRPRLALRRAQDANPFGYQYFDLVISVNCLHNLHIFELQTALAELERVGRAKYLSVQSFRNEQEMYNLQCWALTAESFFDTEEWTWLFQHFGYSGDYEFIYFE